MCRGKGLEAIVGRDDFPVLEAIGEELPPSPVTNEPAYEPNWWDEIIFVPEISKESYIGIILGKENNEIETFYKYCAPDWAVPIYERFISGFQLKCLYDIQMTVPILFRHDCVLHLEAFYYCEMVKLSESEEIVEVVTERFCGGCAERKFEVSDRSRYLKRYCFADQSRLMTEIKMFYDNYHCFCCDEFLFDIKEDNLDCNNCVMLINNDDFSSDSE